MLQLRRARVILDWGRRTALRQPQAVCASPYVLTQRADHRRRCSALEYGSVITQVPRQRGGAPGCDMAGSARQAGPYE